MKFSFEEAEVVDRDPPPIYATVRAVPAIGTDARVEVVRDLRLPDRSEVFAMSSDVEVMWTLYELYKQDRDRLLPMAYSCLTRLEHRARTHPAKGTKRHKAAGMYRMDYEVLDKLGEFTNTLGDEVEVRKLTEQSQLRKPTDKEVKWIEEALKLLIRRAGEYAADPQRNWPELTMGDLPDLD